VTGIRAATPSDVPGLVAILAQTPWEKTAFVRAAVLNNEVSVVDEGAGPIAFAVWNREFFSKPFVWLIAVVPHARRQGLAELLFAHVESACRGSRLYTSTNATNAAMHALLLKRGYVLRGELDLDPGDPEVFYSIDPL
jgi:GNAT superfamily N-acetyltransferase